MNAQQQYKKAHAHLKAVTRGMNPAKYKTLTPSQRKVYDKKANAAFDAWDKAQAAAIAESNAKNHEALAFGIVELVDSNPRIAFEIADRWLKRNGYRTVRA